uniref:Uncharacterized protein n=1 Tax=Timema bartmani TaxID=61472 RepID=A0A7R9ER02_9NEOP|nr:unnamed protein product [Timema bartmani]
MTGTLANYATEAEQGYTEFNSVFKADCWRREKKCKITGCRSRCKSGDIYFVPILGHQTPSAPINLHESTWPARGGFSPAGRSSSRGWQGDLTWCIESGTGSTQTGIDK